MCIFRFFIIVVTLSINPLSFAMLRMQRIPALKVGVTRVRSYSQQSSKNDCPSCPVLACKESLRSALISLKHCHESLHCVNADVSGNNDLVALAKNNLHYARRDARCASNLLKIQQHIIDTHFGNKDSSILLREIQHLDSEMRLLKQEATAFSNKEEALAQEKKIQEQNEKDRQWKNDTLNRLRGEI